MDKRNEQPAQASEGFMELIGRALTDEQFRKLLYDDQKAATEAYRLTRRDREALARLPRETLEEHAQQFAKGNASEITIMIVIRIRF